MEKMTISATVDGNQKSGEKTHRLGWLPLTL